MIASTYAALTISSEVAVMFWTWGRVVTSGMVKARCSSRFHRALSASRILPVNQDSADSNSQPIASALRQDALKHRQQHGGEEREGVADAGTLERGLGLVDLRRITAGGQVPHPADGQVQGRDRGEDPHDPGAEVVDDVCETAGVRRGHRHTDGVRERRYCGSGDGGYKDENGGRGEHAGGSDDGAGQLVVHGGWHLPPREGGVVRDLGGATRSSRERGAGKPCSLSAVRVGGCEHGP